MLSLDTETTGLDVHHGAAPFFVTMCDDRGQVTFYEWDVDPLTRKVQVPSADVTELRQRLEIYRQWSTNYDRAVAERHALVLQNAKFDSGMLRAIGVDNFPWTAVRDLLLAAHLLASNQPKDLTSLGIQYLGRNIESHEQKLHKVVDECRRYCRSKLKDWRIAKAGLPEMPSAREECWKFDTWLPRAVVRHLWETSEAGQFYEGNGQDGEPEEICISSAEDRPGWEYRPPEIEGGDHPYWTALRNYGNADSEITVLLWPVLWRRICERNLQALYYERVKLLPVAAHMEHRGVTLNDDHLQQLKEEYSEDIDRAIRVCENIADGMGYPLKMPRSGNNQSLSKFCFGDRYHIKPKKAKPVSKRLAKRTVNQSLFADNENEVCLSESEPAGPLPCLDLPVLATTDGGNPSLDKNVMRVYAVTLPERSKQLSFINNLSILRKRKKALEALEAYERFRIRGHLPGLKSVVIWTLHSTINPAKTNTLRWGSENPNSQNIEKEPQGDTHSPRYAFGPAPGREWYSCDFQNVELRIPAYESGEQELIALFEKPNEPPYYGSQHLLNFSTVYPEIWEKEGRFQYEDPEHIKKKFKSTWYQRCKNGDFAIQYNCGEATADRTFHRVGAFKLLKSRFAKQEALNQRCIRFATQHGYIETLPDRSVDPKRGYPLLCTRSEWGKIVPTVPLSYRVQGTAMWLTGRAMVRCQAQLDQWNTEVLSRAEASGVQLTTQAARELYIWMHGYHIVLQVHDELVFDFPKKGDPVAEAKGLAPKGSSNLAKIRRIQQLMAQGGEDLIPRVPTPTGCEYHPDNWEKGISL